VGNDLWGLFDDIVVPLIPHTINAMCFYEKKARLLNNLCFINSSALFHEKNILSMDLDSGHIIDPVLLRRVSFPGICETGDSDLRAKNVAIILSSLPRFPLEHNLTSE